MKSTIVIALILLSFLMLFSDGRAVTTLNKGVTIGDWLSPLEDYQIQTTRYTKVDFENIKELGFDHVRITVTFNTGGMTADAISPIQMKCLQNAVMWAEEVGLKVVIADVNETISDATAEALAERLAANWKYVAGMFASKTDDLVLYEILAAPADLITADVWNATAKTIIAAIREVDAKHTIVVGPVMWYSIDELANLEKFADGNILYVAEFCEPVLFTRQNTTFHGVGYNTFGVPFPYNAGRMPSMWSADAGTPSETAYNNYPTQGTVDWVKGRVDAAAAAAAGKGMPLYFVNVGVTTGQQWDWGKSIAFDVPPADRAAWYEAVRTQAELKGIGWTLANYRGNFGVFDNYGGGTENWMMFSNYPYDVNTTVVNSLGLNAPAPSVYVPKPLTEGFTLFDDEVNPMVRVNWWLGEGEPNFFITDNPVSGQYCLGIFYPGQYNALEMFFPFYLDMADLAESGYVLDFFLRCDNDQGHIQARFEMTNEYLEDRPWRMNYDIRNGVMDMDDVIEFYGDWQRFTLPLSQMQDQGAWDPDDRVWYGGPGGQIDWGRVRTFQFVSETNPQPDVEIYIDRVRIVDPVTLVREKGGRVPGEFHLAANYPNPFNPSTTIEYTLQSSGEVTLAVYNLRGEMVKTLVSGVQNAGDYAVQWDGFDSHGAAAPSGVYFYRLTGNNQEMTRRMLLIR